MNATPVSKEEVRLLAIQIGVREAARRLGLEEDRVRQWSSRHKWFSKSPKVLPVTTVTKPSVVLMDELADNERETRLSLSRYARRAAKDSEQLSAREAPLVKAVAQTAAITHRWGTDEGKASHFTLNVLNLNSLEVRPEAEADTLEA